MEGDTKGPINLPVTLPISNFPPPLPAMYSPPLSLGLLVLFLVPLVYHLYHIVLDDYRFFLSLGPGGIPSTPLGYLRICLLKLIVRHNVLVPPPPLLASSPFHPYFRPGTPHPALAFARASGSRPRVAGIAPHRQLTQRGSDQDVARLHAAFEALAAARAALLATGRSCFEKHSLALFLTRLSTALGGEGPGAEVWWNRTCGAPPEIAHLHGGDGSLHLTLHPADARAVMAAGWGERHPLAGRLLPAGYVMVYAPRGEREVELVMDIVRAGAWWVGGVELGESVAN